MAAPLQLEAVDDLRGPAGRLEALLNGGRTEAPLAVLMAHPHPPSGGTMHNKVVYHAMKAFSSLGLPVLRFNFRGAGLSEGVHDHGVGEVEDVHAAADYLTRRLDLPLLFTGFSFGAYVGLRACCGDSRVQALVGLGLPVHAAGRNYTYEFLTGCTAPKLLVSGSDDQFAPPELLTRLTAEIPGPTERTFIAGADHFFSGIPGSPESKLGEMQRVLVDWTCGQLDDGYWRPLVPAVTGRYDLT